jgi:hypothetical protein
MLIAPSQVQVWHPWVSRVEANWLPRRIGSATGIHSRPFTLPTISPGFLVRLQRILVEGMKRIPRQSEATLLQSPRAELRFPVGDSHIRILDILVHLKGKALLALVPVFHGDDHFSQSASFFKIAESFGDLT